MIDISFLDQLDRFNLIIQKRVTSSYSGERKSIIAGHGTVLKDYRQYVRGDDVRAIDWKIFARTDKLHIKQYEEEKNLTAHIVVDSSASMNFGEKITKFDYASMLGIGFAYLAMKQNEKFEFSTFSDSLNPVRAKRGSKHFASLVNYLSTLQIKGKTNFTDVMTKYKKLIKTRSLIVIVSDFLFDIEIIKHALYRLSNNEVIVIQVLDKAEKDLAITGSVRLHDSESNSVLKTFISQRLRNKYHERLEEHIIDLQKTCDQVNARFYSFTTNTSIFDAFYHVFKDKLY